MLTGPIIEGKEVIAAGTIAARVRRTEEFFRSILCFVELLYYVNSLLISVNIQVFV